MPTCAQLVAVTVYGTNNAEGLPADVPKVVRAIAKVEDAKAGEFVLTTGELASVVARNRPAVKAVVDARPQPAEVESDEDKAKTEARIETGTTDDVSALLKKIALLEARISELESAGSKAKQ